MQTWRKYIPMKKILRKVYRAILRRLPHVMNMSASTAVEKNASNKLSWSLGTLSLAIYDCGRASEVYEKIQARCQAEGIGYFLGGSTTFGTHALQVAFKDAESFNAVVMSVCGTNDVFRFQGSGSKAIALLSQLWEDEDSEFYDILVEEKTAMHVSPHLKFYSRIEVTFWQGLNNFSSEDIIQTPRENRSFSRICRETFDDLISRNADIDAEAVNDVFEHKFPIDIVYTWVNDADPVWAARKNQASRDVGKNSTSVTPQRAMLNERFRNRDELLYSLRSIELFAPWVRHIYLVTDNQIPDWLVEDHPKLTIVDHKDIFRDPDMLPCFNSSAIECQLHHIEGLSEHFIYFNDDVMLGQTTQPEDFFLANGQAKFFPSPQRANETDIDDTREEYLIADANALKLLKRDFGFVMRKIMMHTPHPSRRSVLQELEDKYQAEFDACSHQTFRSKFDLRPIAFMQHGLAFMTGRAIPDTISNRYLALWKPSIGIQFDNLLKSREKKTLCINDVGVSCEREEEINEMVSDFLESYFPIPSSFEK